MPLRFTYTHALYATSCVSRMKQYLYILRIIFNGTTYNPL